MLKFLMPDRIVGSIHDIDFAYERVQGIEGVIFDIDNTLVPHGAEATEETMAFFEGLRALGLRTCLISNNDEKRVKPFAEKVQSLYLPNAGKPAMRSYTKAMAMMHTDVDNTLFIGDQILTDIWGAKRLGMKHVLTRPIDLREPWNIRLKRKIEKIILFSNKTKEILEK